MHCARLLTVEPEQSSGMGTGALGLQTQTIPFVGVQGGHAVGVVSGAGW